MAKKAKRKSRGRHVIEGVWSGYSQPRVAHRMICRLSPEAYKVTSIRFTDGTSLDITIRPCKFREKIVEIPGYRELIEDCWFYKIEGFTTVEAIEAARKKSKEEQAAKREAAAKQAAPVPALPT